MKNRLLLNKKRKRILTGIMAFTLIFGNIAAAHAEDLEAPEAATVLAEEQSEADTLVDNTADAEVVTTEAADKEAAVTEAAAETVAADAVVTETAAASNAVVSAAPAVSDTEETVPVSDTYTVRFILNPEYEDTFVLSRGDSTEYSYNNKVSDRITAFGVWVKNIETLAYDTDVTMTLVNDVTGLKANKEISFSAGQQLSVRKFYGDGTGYAAVNYDMGFGFTNFAADTVVTIMVTPYNVPAEKPGETPDVPEIDVPDTEVPDTDVPDTDVPDSEIPDNGTTDTPADTTPAPAGPVAPAVNPITPVIFTPEVQNPVPAALPTAVTATTPVQTLEVPDEEVPLANITPVSTGNNSSLVESTDGEVPLANTIIPCCILHWIILALALLVAAALIIKMIFDNREDKQRYAV